MAEIAATVAATAGTTATQLKSLLNLLPEEKGRPKFGYIVDLDKESRCPHIETFMACHGRILSDNIELRRGRFKPNATPLDARAAFGQERGKAVGQEDIQDENGFILPNDLINMPMKTMSSGCRLNLNFVYRYNVISGAVVSAKDEITDAGQTLRNATTNTPSWWQNLRSSSPAPSSKDSD